MRTKVWRGGGRWGHMYICDTLKKMLCKMTYIKDKIERKNILGLPKLEYVCKFKKIKEDTFVNKNKKIIFLSKNPSRISFDKKK